ncbi:ubiquitin-like modifier-activating enzyme ATG7 [Nematostella vectensis]|uniref:ubiquitin-like modifier-activating enzyme ATG7 n=1 Tax=Nematostella vectensis TaxID=45351 RepID=UPI0020770E64|nr:ubiquitin-like modifier-activating enzyme ATG7 [Nematostella vectensis]
MADQDCSTGGSGILQFAPFSSAVDAIFWHKLKEKKLDEYYLNDEPKPLQGYYVNCDLPGLPCRMSIDYCAFDKNAVPLRAFKTHGQLVNTNTIDAFRSLDKKILMDSVGEKMWENIKSKKALEDPSLLGQFILLTFANLKKYHFYYWFAFPAICVDGKSHLKSPPLPLVEVFTQSQISDLQSSYEDFSEHGKAGVGFFLVKTSGEKVELAHLRDIDSNLQASRKLMVGFADPTTLPSNPGWPLRNFLLFLAFHWGTKIDDLKVLCFRDRFRGGRREIDHSIVLDVTLPVINENECPKYIGWEKNKKQKLGPRSVDLSATMDPEKLAESSVDLNLKLMRWRLLPELDLDVVSSTRCLLLGAGTLGCNVARCLMGWGVRTITFVDNSTISYSNPVRQTLFEFDDCKEGGRPKAAAAAEALKRIFPGVNSSGEMLTIPMPGHTMGQSPEAIASVQRDVTRLEQLIESHDVIFLLMDTRESRWLPTVMAAARHKLVMTAALGFDTYLVMRHGLRVLSFPSCSPSKPDLTALPGTSLGCYFCNDVVAPGNSTRDRTLDQQCTVSRPGMSFIASALAVELLVSILQHPDRGAAPADTSAKDSHLTAEMTSHLGLVPHQIRGFLSRYQTVLPACLAFDKCTACSSKVVEAYIHGGFSFLQKACNVPRYLEDVTGITALMADTLVAEVWEMSDEESLE